MLTYYILLKNRDVNIQTHGSDLYYFMKYNAVSFTMTKNLVGIKHICVRVLVYD